MRGAALARFDKQFPLDQIEEVSVCGIHPSLCHWLEGVVKDCLSALMCRTRPSFGPSGLGCGRNGSTSCRAHPALFRNHFGPSRFCFCPAYLPRLGERLDKFAPMCCGQAAFGRFGGRRGLGGVGNADASLPGNGFELPLRRLDLLLERNYSPQVGHRKIRNRFH